MSLRALLVTSQVTFVPNNYDDLVIGLAKCPHIAGLLVLQNAEAKLSAKAIGIMAMGGIQVGATLLRNLHGNSSKRRRASFAAEGKPVFNLPHINSDEALAVVSQQPFDLLVNARTRFIYKRQILEAPRLGCINVHHGLLPEQRGTMCDLWALHERKPAGFSVHKMSRKIDDGGIISCTQVSDGSDRDYPRYLQRSACMEAKVVADILADIDARDEIVSTPNQAPAGLQHRRNPTWAQMREIRRLGLRI